MSENVVNVIRRIFFLNSCITLQKIYPIPKSTLPSKASSEFTEITKMFIN